MKKLFENPIKLFSPVFPYILIITVLMGLLYISKLNPITENKIPPAAPDSLVLATDLELQEPRMLTAIDPASIKIPSPEMLDKGGQLFASACASCHGTEGRGDGPAGVALNPKPRNFHIPDGWKNGPKVSGMYLTLEKGIPGSGMAAYDFMTAGERLSIIHFIRNTYMQNAPADTDAELATLDKTYNLSAGTRQPGQLPIPAAEELILKEK